MTALGLNAQAAANAAKIRAAVASIPVGFTCSYGEVARRAGLPGRARLVARILRETPASAKLAWYRVIAANGRPAFKPDSEAYQRQLQLLRAEGVQFIADRVQPAQRLGADNLDSLLWQIPD